MIKETTEMELIAGKLFKEIAGHEFDKVKDVEIINGIIGMTKKGGKLTLRERLTGSFGMLLQLLDNDKLAMMVWEFLPEEERDKPLGGSTPEASKKEGE